MEYGGGCSGEKLGKNVVLEEETRFWGGATRRLTRRGKEGTSEPIKKPWGGVGLGRRHRRGAGQRRSRRHGRRGNS